jgi:hypothetical protein
VRACSLPERDKKYVHNFKSEKAKKSDQFEDLSINENVGIPLLKTKMWTRYNIYVSGGGRGGVIDQFLTRHTIE